MATIIDHTMTILEKRVWTKDDEKLRCAAINAIAGVKYCKVTARHRRAGEIHVKIIFDEQLAEAPTRFTQILGRVLA